MNKVLAEEICVIFLSFAVTCELLDICDVRSMDGNLKKAIPGMLEGLIEMQKVWCMGLGSVIHEGTFEGHAVGRESVCCNDMNDLVDTWAVMVPKRKPLGIPPQSFDHHGGTLAWNGHRICRTSPELPSITRIPRVPEVSPHL